MSSLVTRAHLNKPLIVYSCNLDCYMLNAIAISHISGHIARFSAPTSSDEIGIQERGYDKCAMQRTSSNKRDSFERLLFVKVGFVQTNALKEFVVDTIKHPGTESAANTATKV